MEHVGRYDLLRTDRHDDCVASIISSGASSTYIHLCGQNVDQFALPFISPLRAEYDCNCYPIFESTSSYNLGVCTDHSSLMALLKSTGMGLEHDQRSTRVRQDKLIISLT